MGCEYGYGLCKTPWGECPYFQGLFCELDKNLVQLAYHYTSKARPNFVICDESEIVRDYEERSTSD